MSVRLASLFIPLLVAACTPTQSDYLSIDGRMLREINSNIMLGAIYYERNPTSGGQVALTDLCLIDGNVHGIEAPSAAAQPIPGIKVDLSREASGSASGGGTIPGLSFASLNLGAKAEIVEKVTVSFSDLTKTQVSTVELSLLRQKLERGPNCAVWMANISNEGWPIYQVRAVYHATFSVTVELKNTANAKASVEAIKAEIEAKLDTMFKSERSGTANLIAVTLLPRDEWPLTATE
jgi:hypothetical protein